MHKSTQVNTSTISIADAKLILHPYKAIHYPSENTLIISDAHLGKADHFRKSGIAVPQLVNISNIARLNELILHFDPQRIVFLGDLFHSTLNAAWKDVEDLINQFNEKRFELVMGNHDILPRAVYDSSKLAIHEDALALGPFLLTHIPREKQSDLYNLAGHIHPGVVLKGKAKQYLKLPCFFFSDWQGLLPAFGAFTGLYKMSPTANDQVYVVSDNFITRMR